MQCQHHIFSRRCQCKKPNWKSQEAESKNWNVNSKITWRVELFKHDMWKYFKAQMTQRWKKVMWNEPSSFSSRGTFHVVLLWIFSFFSVILSENSLICLNNNKKLLWNAKTSTKNFYILFAIYNFWAMQKLLLPAVFAIVCMKSDKGISSMSFPDPLRKSSLK